MSVHSTSEKMGRIYQLDGLRFVMICIIFMGHCFSDFLCNYSYGWMNTLFSTNFAVYYFFILSGFGIYLNNFNRQVDYSNIDFISSLKYAINKIRKIYPVYIFSMLLYIPLLSFGIGNVVAFCISLTLLQSLDFSGYFFHGINGVSWFLSSLFVAYIFCPYLYKVSSSKKISILLIIDLLVIWLLRYISFAYADIGFQIYRNLVFPLRMPSAIPSLFVFFFGMLMARIYIKYKDTSFKNIYAYVITTVCVCYQLFMGEAVKVLGHTTLSVPTIALCGCFILTVSLNTENIVAKFFKTNTMLTLGKYTMYIFLLHYPALFVTKKIFKYCAIYYGDITGVIELLCVVVLTYLLIKIYLTMESVIITIKNKRLASN